MTAPRPAPVRPRRTVVERIGWLPLACLIGALVVVSSASIVWNTSPYYGRNDRSADTGTNLGSLPPAGGRYSANVVPNRIVIPKLKAVAPIVDVATSPDGELEIPKNPKVVGWWKPGARPGARTGTAVLAGHINFAGVSGTLEKIGKLRPGDRVDIYGKTAGNRKQVAFQVTAVRTYHKTALPYREIFDQKAAGRIALITCGGPFDASTGNYLDNIVVYGVPTGSKAA